MNVRTLCLAILNNTEGTGYEIRKLVTDGHFSHFVDASYGSIYPALNKLEIDGMVVSRAERQAGKPDRKVYSTTAAGRAEFLQSLSKPAQKDIFKSEFLLLAMCAELMDPKDVEQAINAQVAYLENELDIIENGVQQVDLQGADWVAGYGRTCLSAGIDYINANRQKLMAAAGTSLNELNALQAAE